MCRECEVVWVDAPVIGVLPVNPRVTSASAAAPDPAFCPVCGAPYTDYLSDRCRYCRSRIVRTPAVTGGPDVAEADAAGHTADRWPRDIVHEAIENEYGA